MVYTFKQTCKKSIQELLNYLEYSKMEMVKNESIAKIHNYVTDIKQEAEVINQFMTVGEWLDYEVRDARIAAIAEGRAEGRAEGVRNTLLKIVSNKFSADIPTSFMNTLHTLDEETLYEWIMIATSANSIEEFLEKVH